MVATTGTHVVTVGLLLIGAGIIVAFLLSFWRGSEDEYTRWRSRRGEDEDPERYDDRGAFRSHWGGWGRPGGGGG